MKEYIPVVKRSSLNYPERKTGFYGRLPITDQEQKDAITSLVNQQLTHGTILPDTLKAYNEAHQNAPFDPIADERERRKPLPYLTELSAAMFPQTYEYVPTGSTFSEEAIAEKLNIINLILDYSEASSDKKYAITTQLLKRIVKNPEYCLTFYQTLAEYNEINPEQTNRLFDDIRNAIHGRLLKFSRTESRLLLQKKDEEQETYLAILLQVILPSLIENPVDADRDFETKGAVDAALSARTILQGLIDGTETQQHIIQLMYSLTVGGLELQSEEIEKLIYGIIRYKIPDVFNPNSDQAGRFALGFFSTDDDAFAKRALIDYAATVLDRLYADTSTADRFDEPMEQILEHNPEALRLRQEAVHLSQQPGIEGTKMTKKIEFYQSMQGLSLDRIPTDNAAPSSPISYCLPLEYPYDVVAKPYKLKRLYVDLLSRYLLGIDAIQTPIVTLAFPQDGLLRDVVLEQEDTIVRAEQVLRYTYSRGSIRRITYPFVIQDALRYLKPNYSSDDTLPEGFGNIYSQAVFEFPSLRTDEYGSILTLIRIGVYSLPVLYNPNQGFLLQDYHEIPLPEEQRQLWELALIQAYQKHYDAGVRIPFIENLNESPQRQITDAQEIESVLGTLGPQVITPHKTEALQTIHDQRDDQLNNPDTAYGLSTAGDIVKLHDMQVAGGISQIFFDWGRQATTIVEITIGKRVIPLSLDQRYHLVHHDGKSIKISPAIKTWWETIVLSHLAELTCVSCGRSQKPPEPECGDEGSGTKATKERAPVRPHRRALPVGQSPTRNQSLRIEDLSQDKPLVRLQIHDAAPGMLLERWNELLGRDGKTPATRKYTWVLPSDETIRSCKYPNTPAIRTTPNALTALQNLELL